MNTLIRGLLVILLSVVIAIAIGVGLFLFSYFYKYLSLIDFMSTELMVR